MSAQTEEILDKVELFFLEHQNQKEASGMEAYMKNKFSYYGVKSPIRKELDKQLWKSYKPIIQQSWPSLVGVLWDRPQRENQYLAMDMLKRIERNLKIGDLAFIEQLILKKSWWDTVDFLASHCIGKILIQDKGLKYASVDRYMASGELWLRRTALIFQLFYKEKTDADLLFALIDDTRGSKEFFINKGSGWALRQYSKVNRGAVAEYLESRTGELSNLTVKEASKYL